MRRDLEQHDANGGSVFHRTARPKINALLSAFERTRHDLRLVKDAIHRLWSVMAVSGEKGAPRMATGNAI